MKVTFLKVVKEKELYYTVNQRSKLSENQELDDEGLRNCYWSSESQIPTTLTVQCNLNVISRILLQDIMVLRSVVQVCIFKQKALNSTLPISCKLNFLGQSPVQVNLMHPQREYLTFFMA